MSYDLNVYGKSRLDLDSLYALIRAIPGLDVEPPDGIFYTIVAVRGTRATATFELDAPVAIEAEDIPPDVVAQAIGLAVLYEIHAHVSEGSALASVVRFAKSLAVATGGVMHDAQTDAVWPRSSTRKAERVKGMDRIDMVELTWYASGSGNNFAHRFLTEARRHLPEALPRRFGTFEPLQGRLERDGDDTFLDEAARDDSVYFKGMYPVISGGIDGPSALPAPVSRLELSIPRPVLELPDWRAAIDAFFLAMSRNTSTVFAYAEVIRNVGWTGQSNWYDGQVEEHHSLVVNQRGWIGIHPYPVWITYFGRDYADLLRDHLAGTGVEQPFGGLLIKWSDDPMDRDALARKIAATRATPRSGATWLPDDLLGRTPLPQDERRHLLSPAQNMPRLLRTN